MSAELDPADRVFDFAQTDADGFREGRYLYRRRGCVDMPVLVWWGPPLDLEEGGFLDRSPRWQITVAGHLVTEDDRLECFAPSPFHLEQVWPAVQGRPTKLSETAYRQARIEHARRYDPNDPFGHERGRVDLFTATPPF